MTRTIKIFADTAAEASCIYCAKRDATRLGASRFAMGRWGDFFISYNGKVWRDDPAAPDWAPGKTPVYDPYAQ